jgi:predicted protein tyrosine phosphatase
MQRILFICSQNKLRSPTAEQVFCDYPGLEAASAGTNHDAEVPIGPDLLRWADVIFVMEKVHRIKLSRRFQKHLASKRIICLDIPDRYGYMDLELVECLKTKVSKFLNLTRLDD